MASAARRAWVGGNWKCNGTRESVDKLVSLYNAMTIPDSVEVVCAPTALHVAAAVAGLRGEVAVAVQNVWNAGADGAYTGEITGAMARDAGATWAIVGHSERRHTVAHEPSQLIAEKTRAALDSGLKVVVCVGELKEDRETDKTMDVLREQLAPVIATLGPDDWKNVVVAYEPVWAIGTGLTATPDVAQATHKELRDWIASQASPDVAASVRLVYGGSVKGANCAELFAQPDIDGFLVGGASLKEEFGTIVASGAA